MFTKNLPKHLYLNVDTAFTHKHPQGYMPAIWFAITSTPGRAWGCHVLLENGAIYRNLPLHALHFGSDISPANGRSNDLNAGTVMVGTSRPSNTLIFGASVVLLIAKTTRNTMAHISSRPRPLTTASATIQNRAKSFSLSSSTTVASRPSPRTKS